MKRWKAGDVIKAWQGDFGVFAIPDEYQSVRITKKGWPDKRYKMALGMVEKMEEIDRQRFIAGER
jgi:hypothetical protein